MVFFAIGVIGLDGGDVAWAGRVSVAVVAVVTVDG